MTTPTDRPNLDATDQGLDAAIQRVMKQLGCMRVGYPETCFTHTTYRWEGDACQGAAHLARAAREDVAEIVREASEKALEEVGDMLDYLDLHLGRYHWRQLTTEQKELMADLIDASGDRGEDQPPRHVERWWRDDYREPVDD